MERSIFQTRGKKQEANTGREGVRKTSSTNQQRSTQQVQRLTRNRTQESERLDLGLLEEPLDSLVAVAAAVVGQLGVEEAAHDPAPERKTRPI